MIYDINIQFPDKSGFTLRYNPASGITATRRPAKPVRVGFTFPIAIPITKVGYIVNIDF